ncbi:MAG: hypothetical protein Q7J73_03465 [Dehalococcoidales bacterium]|nr:hypothetical protein [Dehalococcoidales bacterium]
MAKGVIEWEHNRKEGLVVRIKPGFGELFTGETRRHVLAVPKETLLALRGLIDITVKRMEEKEKKTEKQSTKIEVE